MGFADDFPDADTRDWPRLVSRGYKITSKSTGEYNCFAWAAGDMRNWWDTYPGRFWPSGVPREFTLDNLKHAFATVGYESCAHGNRERGYQKIAIYALPVTPHIPTHAARQLGNGYWTSKMGELQDLSHKHADAVSDGIYGAVVGYMRRRKVTKRRPSRRAGPKRRQP